MEMGFLGRSLIIFGLIMLAIGLMLVFFQKIPFLGKLPGDILIKKENFTFYFPLATSVILSLIVSLILIFLNRK